MADDPYVYPGRLHPLSLRICTHYLSAFAPKFRC